jgi:hypothetical protein
VQDRGALTHHSCLSSRGCPWGCRGLGLGTPSLGDNARPREVFHGSWSGETGRVALMALAEALDAHRRRQ